MITSDEARAHLTTEMGKRRVALRLQWQEVAARAKMSIAHLGRIRNNETPLTPLMAGALEDALQWSPGSVDRILAGGHPDEMAQVSATTNHVPAEQKSQNDVAAQDVLNTLRQQADAGEMTLGEVLVRRGLAEPQELLVPDALPPDPIIEEVNASNISQETKERIIKIHLENRARLFEEERLRRLEERQANESPDGEV